MSGKIFSIAHRGFSGQYPENTLIAFAEAAAVGADMIELDVTCAKDGEIVVIHDDTLNRTTNGQGEVSDFTLAELKGLDAGIKFAPGFAHERIPTLAEIFVLLRETPLRFCIEIKKLPDGQTPRPFIERIIRAIYDHDMASRSILIGFEADYLALAKQIDPLLSTGYNPGDYDGKTGWEIVRATLAIHADLLIPYHIWLTAELVEEWHAHGIPAWTWTVNEEDAMRRALAVGADGIITNYPDRLKIILAKSS